MGKEVVKYAQMAEREVFNTEPFGNIRAYRNFNKAINDYLKIEARINNLPVGKNEDLVVSFEKFENEGNDAWLVRVDLIRYYPDDTLKAIEDPTCRAYLESKAVEKYWRKATQDSEVTFSNDETTRQILKEVGLRHVYAVSYPDESEFLELIMLGLLHYNDYKNLQIPDGSKVSQN